MNSNSHKRAARLEIAIASEVRERRPKRQCLRRGNFSSPPILTNFIRSAMSPFFVARTNICSGDPTTPSSIRDWSEFPAYLDATTATTTSLPAAYHAFLSLDRKRREEWRLFRPSPLFCYRAPKRSPLVPGYSCVLTVNTLPSHVVF